MSVVESHIYSFNANNAAFLPNGNQFSSGIFIVPEFIHPPHHCHSVYVSVENAQIPSSWYVINTTNNVLLFTFMAVNYSLVVPVGNYDAYSLVAELNSLLTANGITAFIFFYNSVDNHIGIEWTPYSYNPAIFISFSTQSTIFTPLGITSNDLVVYETTPEYEFSSQCNLSGVMQYFIQCNSIPTRNWSSQIGGNVLASIQNAASVFGLTLYTNLSNLKYSVPTTANVNQLEIVIFDQTGQVVNFNGIPWILTLRVSYVVDENRIDDLHTFVNNTNQTH